LSTDELSISKSCYICLKKLKIDFVDILNVLLHKVLSNYKLECPGKNTPGTKTHIMNTFQFDLCVCVCTCITVIDKVLLRKEVRQKGTD